ncbi:MAG TPA: MarR family transcriptional regulator [Gemmatimonadaceae bacterium]|nr:MarR family transcriptional regulator [Gemmatimonadaceae bacterium]
MQQLLTVNSTADADRCAAAVLDVGLAVSRLVRAQVRRHRPVELTLPQVRALAFVNADPDCAPSQLAEYLMLSRPAVTRLLDGLVQRKLVTRRLDARDRRRLKLAVTRAGRSHLDAYFTRARAVVAERLAGLTPRQRAAVRRAMTQVLPSLAAARTADDGGEAR